VSDVTVDEKCERRSWREVADGESDFLRSRPTLREFDLRLSLGIGISAGWLQCRLSLDIALVRLAVGDELAFQKECSAGVLNFS
jgi:hypothetical protein